MSCQAIRQGDQMQCGSCGVQWDINDPDPPPCGRSVGALTAARERLEAEMIVHTCGNCKSNKRDHCAFYKWGVGTGVSRENLQALMKVDHSRCTKWRLKR